MSARTNYKHLRPIQIFPGSAISDVLRPPLCCVVTHSSMSHAPLFRLVSSPVDPPDQVTPSLLTVELLHSSTQFPVDSGRPD